MSLPHEPVHIKFISSLFSPEKEFIDKIIKQLEDICGPVDWVSPELFFDRTRYYAGEMGWPLHRRFISFKNLAAQDQLVQLKHKTNGVEQQYVTGENRKINIDPGYISPERLILATGKNFTHRVYLSQGIYADLTLIFQKGCFTSLPWTYPDYADPAIIELFNEVRKRYMNALKQGRGFEKC